MNSTHSLNRKVLHWLCCSRCGLIAIRNDVTRRALNKVCEGNKDDEDEDYLKKHKGKK